MLVFRRPWLTLVAASLLALALLLGPTLSARLLIALLGAIIAGAMFTASLLRNTEQPSTSSRRSDDNHAGSNGSSTEIFALGKLFEATTSGMREGLLVIDSDMRVVASNQAAHQLFTLYEGRLESQRLTELTRQPAVYSA